MKAPSSEHSTLLTIANALIITMKLVLMLAKYVFILVKPVSVSLTTVPLAPLSDFKMALIAIASTTTMMIL